MTKNLCPVYRFPIDVISHSRRSKGKTAELEALELDLIRTRSEAILAEQEAKADALRKKIRLDKLRMAMLMSKKKKEEDEVPSGQRQKFVLFE